MDEVAKTITSYQYDSANQLLTAEKGESLWHYVYDSNGSLVEVLPNGSEGNGAKRYTLRQAQGRLYNTAGHLTQVETHNGTGWDTQAEMAYNGLGQRLSMNAAGVIAYYVMDGNRPLTAETSGNVTTFLYGLGAIAEQTTTWNYILPDGSHTPRQLTDSNGEITLSTRYTPWGDTLERNGTGNFQFGYPSIALRAGFGALMDEVTGLLYVGNGQYYDPSTGRFLTRNANPNSPNPYLPFDPTGLLLGPLGLLVVFYAGRRNKKSAPYVVLLIVLVALPMSVSLACRFGGSAPAPSPTPTQPPATGTPTPGEINGGNAPSDPGAPSPQPTPCPTPTPTPTPQVPTPLDEDRYYRVYNTLLDPQYRNYWWRTMDDGVEMIMAVMSYLEFRTLKDDSGYIKAVTDALSNRYRYACPAGCPVVNGVLDGGFRWIMRWSHSLMNLENGMTRDLEASSIDPSFAKSTGESIIRNNRSYDYDRPFGAFNPQSDKEFNYFREKHKFNGDTNYDGVYWWSPESAKSRPVAIVITHRQSNVHCTTNNPEYGVDKGITCGN